MDVVVISVEAARARSVHRCAFRLAQELMLPHGIVLLYDLVRHLVVERDRETTHNYRLLVREDCQKHQPRSIGIWVSLQRLLLVGPPRLLEGRKSRLSRPTSSLFQKVVQARAVDACYEETMLVVHVGQIPRIHCQHLSPLPLRILREIERGDHRVSEGWSMFENPFADASIQINFFLTSTTRLERIASCLVGLARNFVIFPVSLLALL